MSHGTLRKIMPFPKFKIDNIQKGIMKLSDNFLSNDPHALQTSPRHVEKHLVTFKNQILIEFYASKSLKHQGMTTHPSRMGLGGKDIARGKNSNYN